MILKQSKTKILLLVLATMLLLSLPLIVGAQTTNGITGPEDGATVNGEVEITGYASDPSFAKWQLDVLPGGDANAAIFLATGTESGDFSYTLDTAGLPDGEHALRLRVVRDDSNYDEYVYTFTIANASAPAAEATPVAEEAAAAPTEEADAEPVATAVAQTMNGITSPEDGATVNGEVEVMGYASDPSFAKWQLDVLPGGDANAAIFLATGTESGDFSYTLDTAGLPDGEHALRLRVVRDDSNYDEYVNTFTIANASAPAAEATPVAEEAATAPEEAATAPTEEAAAEPVATAVAQTSNGVVAPKDGATVTGEVEVMGYASDPSFAKWQLDLLPGGDANAAIFLATGTDAGDFTYTLDTTGLPNGEHALRLRVVRADSNYDEYVISFTIAN